MSGFNIKNEEGLIATAKNNQEIFGKLYDFYYPKIFGYIFRLTGDHVLASDISSETFLKAWLKIGLFRWRGISISSWFFKIATNELNQYYRKKKYTPYLLMDLSFFEAAVVQNTRYSKDQPNEINIKLEQGEEFMNLHKKLKTLSPDYQKVIALRYFEEMSIRQISEILGKKENTIKSLLSRGLDKLKILF